MGERNSGVSATVRILIITSLAMTFVGCAQNSSTQNSADNIPFPNTGGMSTDVDGLHIQSLSGIQCSLFSDTLGWLSNPVLATSRLSYDTAELQQMAMFFEKLLWVFDPSSHRVSLNDLMNSPPTLRWALGAGARHGYDCQIAFQITNSGNTTVQIPSGGVKLKKAPQRNDYQYRLIDVCTLIPPPKGGINPLYDGYCGTQMGSNPGQCDGYQVGVNVSDVKEGSVFNAPIGGEPCPILTLSSGQSTVLSFYFLPSSSTSPDNLIYSFVPELTLSTSAGSHTLTLPQLEVTVAFAKDSQVSCYGLQETSFVLEKEGPFGKIGHSWCL